MSNNNSIEKREYIFRRKPKHLGEGSADDKFDVVVPKKFIAVLLGIFVALFAIQFLYFSGLYLSIYDSMMGTNLYSVEDFPIWPYWFVPLIFLAISVVPLIAWGEIGTRFASKSMVNYLGKTVKKTKPKPAEFILGFPMRTKDIHYLEAYPMDLDLGSQVASLKIFVSRVLQVLTLSLGMSTLIAQTLAPYLWSVVQPLGWYVVIEELMIDMVLYIGPFTLLILAFIMPTFWIATDTQAYRVNEQQDSVRLGLYLKSGILSKILGFFGLVLVYNLANEFAANLFMGTADTSYGELMADPLMAANVFGTTFIWFGLIIAMSAAIPFLVTLLYLWFYHEKWVNNTRIEASEFMDLGTLQIQEPDLSELEYSKHPEKIDKSGQMFGEFFQEKNGKIILFVLMILASYVCIYSAFIFGYEDVLFGVGEVAQAAMHVFLYVLAFGIGGAIIAIFVKEKLKK